MKKFFKAIKTQWILYLILLPSLIYLVIFCYAPMFGIVIAFKDYVPSLGIFKSPNVGFAKFEMFFSSYYFKDILINTLALSVISLIVNTPLPIILALLINEVQNKKIKKFIQTISYAPYFISLVVLVGMFNMFLKTDGGMINKILNLLNIPSVDFLGNEKYFRAIYVISGLWQGIGWWSIIYVGALSNVDKSLHEAASIDGASRFQRIIHINLPYLKPLIVITFIMAVGSLMSIGFEKVYLMQNASNREVSEIIATYAYTVAFKNTKDFGFGSAIGLFNSVINSFLLIIANFISKKVNNESLF